MNHACHAFPVSLNSSSASCHPLPACQATAQAEVIEQQRSRVRDLEASVRQLDGRCSDLRDVSAGHDQRAKDAQVGWVQRTPQHMTDGPASALPACMDKGLCGVMHQQGCGSGEESSSLPCACRQRC
jgi:hypothetical protein